MRYAVILVRRLYRSILYGKLKLYTGQYTPTIVTTTVPNFQKVPLEVCYLLYDNHDVKKYLVQIQKKNLILTALAKKKTKS